MTAGNKTGNKKEGAKRKKPSQVRGLGGLLNYCYVWIFGCGGRI